jgi:hypothetical protein
MTVYYGKDAFTATKEMTATHSTVRNPAKSVEGVGCKLFMENLFSYFALIDDLTTGKIVVELQGQTVKTCHLTVDVKH